VKNILKLVLVLSAVFAIFVLTGCTEKDKTEVLLKKQGYTHITTDGYSFFGCSKGDTFRTKFYAKSSMGETISGVACSGWFKGTTLRFD
jgi:hypothetical protein